MSISYEIEEIATGEKPVEWSEWWDSIAELDTPLTSLSFKFNKGVMTDDEATDIMANLSSYVKEFSTSKVHFVSYGFNQLGKNEEDHYHVHIIVDGYISANESRRRGVFFRNAEVAVPTITMKQALILDSQQALDCLAYPWKEGIPKGIPNYLSRTEIPKHLKLMMKDYATALFASKQQRDRAKVRASEKSSNLITLVEEIVKAKTFSDYQEYKNTVYDIFYEGLELDDMPEFRSLQSAVQKVAIKYKIVRPAYFDHN